MDAQFGATVKAAEITSYVNSVILQELKESTRAVSDACVEPVLVLIPSATFAGKIFKPDDQPIQYATSQGIDLVQVRWECGQSCVCPVFSVALTSRHFSSLDSDSSMIWLHLLHDIPLVHLIGPRKLVDH